VCSDVDYCINDGDSVLKRRTGIFLTKSNDEKNHVRVVSLEANKDRLDSFNISGVIRPVFHSYIIFSQIYPNRVIRYNGCEEVEYGEYPQYAADSKMQDELKKIRKYDPIKLKETGRSYTFNSVKFNPNVESHLIKVPNVNLCPRYRRKDNEIHYHYEEISLGHTIEFEPVTYKEYEYQGKKYICMRANFIKKEFKLSNGVEYKDGDWVWVEVSPVAWLIDVRTGLLISKRGLASGLGYCSEMHEYKGDFNDTLLNGYLNKYMKHDLTQATTYPNFVKNTFETNNDEYSQKRILKK
jgi:hypothetical protein